MALPFGNREPSSARDPGVGSLCTQPERASFSKLKIIFPLMVFPGPYCFSICPLLAPFAFYLRTGQPEMVLVVKKKKNLPANAGDVRDVDLTRGSGISPGERHGNPLQYSCLENPVDRGAHRATVHGVAKSQTRLNNTNPF